MAVITGSALSSSGVMMRLFELSCRNQKIFFSPFVWRAKLCLAHKGVTAQTVPWRFLDKEAIEPSGSKAVPVIECDGEWIADSWKIACWLEDRYSDAPSLFGGNIGKAQARFISLWADRNLVFTLFPMLAADVHMILPEAEQTYFRQSREKVLGRTLEEARDGREQLRPKLMAALAPLTSLLKEQSFICGENPGYADYAVFGPFVWASCVSTFQVTEPNPQLDDWLARMGALYDGLANKAARVD